MYCQKCGTELPENAIFCSKCGTNQQSFNRPESIGISQNSKASSNKAVSMGISQHFELPKIKPIYYLLIGVVLVITVLISIIVNEIGKMIDFNDYAKVSFEGYNTRGIAKYEFDEKLFFSKYGDILRKHGISKKNKEKFYEVLEQVAKSEVDKTTDLSNGDEVTLTWSIDEEELKDKLGLKSKTQNKIFTVDGLRDIKTFDAFEGLEIQFSGIDGSAYVSLKKIPENNGLDYSIEPQYDLSQGDTVTVRAECYNLDSYIEKYGQMPKENEKKYTVGPLDRYTIYDADVTDEFMDRFFDAGKLIAEEKIVNLCSYWDELYNINSEPSAFWGISGRVTGEIMPVKIWVGNHRTDKKHNNIYVVYNVPYEAYVKSNTWDGNATHVGDVIGRGYCYVVVKFMDALIMENDFSVGEIDYWSTNAYINIRYVDTAIEAERDKYNFTEYPVPGYKEPEKVEQQMDTINQETDNQEDDKEE